MLRYTCTVCVIMQHYVSEQTSKRLNKCTCCRLIIFLNNLKRFHFLTSYCNRMACSGDRYSKIMAAGLFKWNRQVSIRYMMEDNADTNSPFDLKKSEEITEMTVTK